MQLYIGNKNYSSWSMRPWVLMREFGIDFDEVMLRFDGFEATSRFKQAIARISPVAKVPVLVDGEFTVWDTLAIAEYLAEKFPDRALWPRDMQARARARSLCAEMHSGFGGLRSACPQNIEASLPEVGAKVLAEQATARADLARLDAMWTDALNTSGGPFLFGAYSVADAYFAPVVGRMRTYALPVSAPVDAYLGRVWASPGVAAWVKEALAERDFLDFEEPYRKK
ncbi:MAG: glutathione S-transferase family protein [Ideonella sp.]|nr:glutathione S-transferase family protein [Ideonella sp.]MBL0149343.1 glutathione S-transferase family protein [Ideonella sp.]